MTEHPGPPPDPVAAAHRQAETAAELVRSGCLDDPTAQELELAIAELRADLTNGENPESSLARIQRLVARADVRPPDAR